MDGEKNSLYLDVIHGLLRLLHESHFKKAFVFACSTTRGPYFRGRSVNSTSASWEVVVAVTMFLRLRITSAFVVLVPGTPESVNVVRVLQSDASCALDVQLGVSFDVSNELTSSDNSSSVSLKETLVEAAHAAPPGAASISLVSVSAAAGKSVMVEITTSYRNAISSGGTLSGGGRSSWVSPRLS